MGKGLTISFKLKFFFYLEKLDEDLNLNVQWGSEQNYILYKKTKQFF